MLLLALDAEDKQNFILKKCLCSFSSDHGSSNLSNYDQMMKCFSWAYIQMQGVGEHTISILKSRFACLDCSVGVML